MSREKDVKIRKGHATKANNLWTRKVFSDDHINILHYGKNYITIRAAHRRTKKDLSCCSLSALSQVEQSTDNKCVLANCLRTCLLIVFQMAYFLIPDAILFEFGPFLGNLTRV